MDNFGIMVENKNAHIYDIDNILWNIDRKVWVINKKYPVEPIFKIDESDFETIKTGVFRKQGNVVNYSGTTYYIPEQLKTKLEEKGLMLTDVGFSMQEHINKDIIETLDFKILTENLTPLVNKKDDLYLISNIKIDTHKSIYNKLEDKLEEIGHKPKKIYTISESFYNQDDDEVIWSKGNVLLTHLTGHIIKDNQFSEECVENYNLVDYYDTDINTTNALRNINHQFENLYNNSSDDVKQMIRERFVGGKKVKLNINLVTTNQVNKYNTFDVVIGRPGSIMKTFESFKMKMVNEGNNLDNYSSREPIKADNGENLYEYWKNVYNGYSDDMLDDAFQNNMQRFVKSILKTKKILPSFIFDVMIDQCEIALVHILVLNKIRNERHNIDSNYAFDELLDTFKNKDVYKAIINKIQK